MLSLPGQLADETNGRNSFALNGNHEMYSGGRPYFNRVLPSFNQEASYFTLYNDYWQIHGLDTAYVPFSIDGSVPTEDKAGFWKRFEEHVKAVVTFVDHENFDAKPDARLRAQWEWLEQRYEIQEIERTSS